MVRTPSHAILLLAAVSAVFARTARAADEETPTARPIVRDLAKGPASVRIELDRDAVEIPQPLLLSITLQAERGVGVTWPEIDKLLGDFGVEKIDQAPPTRDEMHETTTWRITLSPMVPGDSQVPPLSFAITDDRPRADGSPGRTEDVLETPALRVKVTQRLADLKDPATIMVPTSLTLLYWMVGVLGALVLVGLIARRVNRGPVRVLPTPTTPAHLWALAELDILASEGLIERGRVQEWFYRINAIVRQYIERRFGLNAGEQTSEEFIRAVQHSGFLSDEHKVRLRRFVDACDPVKYARHVPGPGEIDWVNATAREFVLQTAQTEAPALRQEAAA